MFYLTCDLRLRVDNERNAQVFNKTLTKQKRRNVTMETLKH